MLIVDSSVTLKSAERKGEEYGYIL